MAEQDGLSAAPVLEEDRGPVVRGHGRHGLSSLVVSTTSEALVRPRGHWSNDRASSDRATGHAGAVGALGQVAVHLKPSRTATTFRSPAPGGSGYLQGVAQIAQVPAACSPRRPFRAGPHLNEAAGIRGRRTWATLGRIDANAAAERVRSADAELAKRWESFRRTPIRMIPDQSPSGVIRTTAASPSVAPHLASLHRPFDWTPSGRPDDHSERRLLC
jgi:hypothetical protein